LLAATWKYRVRLTRKAVENLERLFDILGQRDVPAAEHAIEAIERAFALLAYTPFAPNARVRELLISFGRAGLVAPYEIEDARTMTVSAVRHQREAEHH
jgi:plasmid stabilization system protein ParE